MSMSENSLLCLGRGGFHRMAYTDWGSPERERVLVCVHGLTRNGRDFDLLAAALEDRFRIVCPDVVGRGRSDWLSRASGYAQPQYMADMTTLIARLGAAEIDWLGTSMGGIMGMLLAAQPGSPIRRLVLNDVGAFLPKAALQRIAGYVGRDPHFTDLDELEAYLREVQSGFGCLTDQQWRHMAVHSARSLDGGGIGLAYDPAIGDAFEEGEIADLDLWSVWDAISCPVLLLRGANSDLLLQETAAEMTRRGPKAKLVEIPDCGHAPALMAPEQIASVRNWLLS